MTAEGFAINHEFDAWYLKYLWPSQPFLLDELFAHKIDEIFENNFVKIDFQAERDAEQGLTNDSNSQVKFSCPEPEEEQDDEVIIVSKLAVRQQWERTVMRQNVSLWLSEWEL